MPPCVRPSMVRCDPMTCSSPELTREQSRRSTASRSRLRRSQASARWRREDPVAGAIVISDRRDDSTANAGRLYDHLVVVFGKDRVFNGHRCDSTGRRLRGGATRLADAPVTATASPSSAAIRQRQAYHVWARGYELHRALPSRPLRSSQRVESLVSREVRNRSSSYRGRR